MSIRFTFVLIAVLICLTSSYINPVQGNFDSPDPGVMRDVDGTFYAATTGGTATQKFRLWKSKDMGSWLLAGYGFTTPPAWTDGGDFWAPEIHHVNNKYNLYYTARTKAHKLCIGVAYADHPMGPYTDIGGPLIEQADLGLIDATYLKDSNNKSYLIYKTDGNAVQKPTQIYAIELTADGRKVNGTRVLLIRDTLAFEGGIVEAPWVIYENAYYYLFYSSCGYANRCYSVSVARSKQLLGPYEKFNRTILFTKSPQDQKSMEGPGHCSVIKGVNGHWAIVYHAWPHNAIGTKRLMLLDEIKWTADKWPYVGSPSQIEMPLP